MDANNILYDLYERRLAGQVPVERVPSHVGVILDGNRRWAKSLGVGASQGHKRGADKLADFLTWSEDAGVKVVTLWLLSTDNLNRDPLELAPLLEIIVSAVDDLAAAQRWRLRLVGAVDILPKDVATRVQSAVASTKDIAGMEVNVAIGYGGRTEITDAVREILRERAAAGDTLESVADSLTVEDITEHLYTKGQPDPELVIRTSGEQRLSGFLLWQSVHTELYFCEVYWPEFRHIDFLRALRDYGQRERRLGK